MNIGIISLNIGNIASVKNMLLQLGHNVVFLDKPDDIHYQALILPGVGSYDHGMKKLIDNGWANYFNENKSIKNQKTKVIGICLGMQLLCDGSEEGDLPGLGLIPGFFKKFDKSINLPIPHMGWNEVNFIDEKNKINKIDDREPRFYFVHSYYYTHSNNNYVLATTTYSVTFPCMIKNKNILGTQFHPEKSHFFGKELFKVIL